MTNEDRKNAFLAMGVADALGYEFEFSDPRPDEVWAFIDDDSAMVISDDTQMALFGLEGVTIALTEKMHIVDAVRAAYLDWYGTQTQQAIPAFTRTRLAQEPKMYACRAPGRTCLESMSRWAQDMPINAKERNGCGTVMRLLPFTFLIPSHGIVRSTRAAIGASHLTHQGDEIQTSTVQFMLAAEQALGGMEIDIPDHIHAAENILALGEGWTAQSALDMALWALEKSDGTFEDLMAKAITHRGDSDSVAAVAACLWALRGGKVPLRLMARLSEAEVISQSVDRYNACFTRRS